MTKAQISKLVSGPSDALEGRINVPGDKSISHRALMLGAITIGTLEIRGLLEGEDVLATASAMAAMGATIEHIAPGHWRVTGVGIGGLKAPEHPLDMGNSGTAARLLMGLVAGHPLEVTFVGDASLSSRPMGRVTDPLARMGAAFSCEKSDMRLPLTVSGTATALPVEHTLEVASAQVKSAMLFAGLSAPGITRVFEPVATRDHSENMLRYFGADIEVEAHNGGRRISLAGQPELLARDVTVPGDISSAAFPMVAALVRPGSNITLENVGVNPLRTGLIETLQEMGGDIRLQNERTQAGEPVADLVIKASPLKAVRVPAARAPSMIDEYPVLAVAAAFADGTTRMEGLAELRVKESDRLEVMADGLRANGVDVKTGDDWMEVTGSDAPKGGGVVHSHLDHRIAMAFAVLGMGAENALTVDDAAPIQTSFPGFVDLMNGLGGNLKTDQ